jgi:hypothetical protein
VCIVELCWSIGISQPSQPDVPRDFARYAKAREPEAKSAISDEPVFTSIDVLLYGL